MSLLLQLHLFGVAFWLGVVSVEFLLERSRSQSRAQGFSVAVMHRKIDLMFETPAFLLVLVSGLMLVDTDQLSGLYVVKIAAGLIAVVGNILCVIPVLRRSRAAEMDDLTDVIKRSRQIDFISLLAIPAGLVALAVGIHLASTR
ncbi:hypothetical protein [Pseudomonas citronellolis]|uniref:hypothetical protein n=1 Tax=Pseudomonas citronellolis TaxID=53408 RepID=UPI0021BFC36C|nr:hypothetical protein [Pseudomonas citronellolis]UXJ53553.1 hypothetical protein N5P21_04855 [Pseudomonas citronellolis]